MVDILHRTGKTQEKWSKCWTPQFFNEKESLSIMQIISITKDFRKESSVVAKVSNYANFWSHDKNIWFVLCPFWL